MGEVAVALLEEEGEHGGGKVRGLIEKVPHGARAVKDVKGCQGLLALGLGCGVGTFSP